MEYHRPVLLADSLAGLKVKEDGIYVDVTFGGGGHSQAILEKLGKKGRLIAFDQDGDAIKNGFIDERFMLLKQNFRHLNKELRFLGIRQVDGLLADLGISSHQIDEPTRGFSTRFDVALDMRMNQDSSQSASEILNSYSADELYRIFKHYGELRRARAIAEAIVNGRQNMPIKSTGDLKKVLIPLLDRRRENKELAQVFQAIRIEVNHELDYLGALLLQTSGLIKKGGRLCVISYHSLEDRMVKNFIRSGKLQGEAEKDFYGHTAIPFIKIGQLITPSEEELLANPRSRSAKLRIAEKI